MMHIDRQSGAGDPESRLLVFLADVVAGRTSEPRPVDDEFAGLLRTLRFSVLARRRGLSHPSFAAEEQRSFVTTSYVISVSSWCVDVLRSAGVRSVTLKGPALAAQLYGDPVLRPSIDADILVAPADMDRARDVFASAGLRGGVTFPTWYERRWHYHAVFDNAPPHARVSVELHWGFSRPGLSRGDVSDLLVRTVAVDCGDHVLPAPALGWQLLVAANQAVLDYFALRPLLDVALIGRRLSREEWSEAARQAAHLGLEPALYYSVTVSAERLGWRVPELIGGLRPPAWRDRIVRARIARLPAVGSPDRRAVQVMKFVTPLVTSSGPRVVKGLAYQVSDRPRVARMFLGGGRDDRAVIP